MPGQVTAPQDSPAAAATITAIAGSGEKEWSGDGGDVMKAGINPDKAAADGQGNIFIADSENNRVRKATGGIVSTVAGTGKDGFSGDGGDATKAEIYDVLGVAVDQG